MNDPAISGSVVQWMTEPVSSFLQTALWVLVVVLVLLIFRSAINTLMASLIDRVRAGAAFKTPWLSVSETPESIRTGRKAIATTEGVSSVQPLPDIETALTKKEYPDGIVEDIFLVHEANVVEPRTSHRPGRYTVRVSLEAYDDATMQDVERVTYRLWDTADEKVVATQARSMDFQLWLSIWGEYTVVAYVERKGKPPVWVTRYLDLPGRPPE